MTFHVNFMLIHCFNLTMKNISLAMKYLGHNPEYTTVYIKAVFIHLTIKIYQPKYIKTGFSNFFHTMVSLEDNSVAGQGSELETHVFLVRSSTTEHPHIFCTI